MSVTRKYRAEIVSIENPLDSIYTVEFKSLDGKFRYLPGQFLHLALDEYDPSSAWPESRCFSMQSSPSEGNIRITYSIKGAFTQEMAKKLTYGSVIWLKLAYGDLFSQDHNKGNTVFIAGGTGITPYLSLFSDPSFSEYINPVVYLGFRSKPFNIYLKEIEHLKNSNIIVKVFYEDVDGILDINKIFSENRVDSTYFISGPPKMISSFKNSLLGFGVDDINIKTDEWE